MLDVVIEGFVSEEKDFELNLLGDWEPAENLEDGGEQEWVSGRAAEFWVYFSLFRTLDDVP